VKIAVPFQRKKARIEIIPLIDIIFFLLATFMIVSLSMIKNSGIAVNLPQALTASPQEGKESVTISITEEGTVYFNQEMISVSVLGERLKDLQISQRDLQVVINGDEMAYFGKAIEILDLVRALGITKVAIQTQPRSSLREN